ASTLRHLAAAAWIGAGLMASCASDSPPRIPVIPSDVVAGVVSSTMPLDVGGVASDSLNPSGLASLLQNNGFVAGAHREFSPGPLVRRVDVRVLDFDSSDGAGAYLTWLDAHASELIGRIEARESIQVNDSTVTVFAH